MSTWISILTSNPPNWGVLLIALIVEIGLGIYGRRKDKS